MADATCSKLGVRLRPDKRLRSRLKLAANGVYARARAVSEIAAGDVPAHPGFADLSVRGPGQGPVSGSDSQPLPQPLIRAPASHYYRSYLKAEDHIKYNGVSLE